MLHTIYDRLRAFLSRHRHPVAFLVALLVAVGPDLLVALEGRPLSVVTVGRALAGVLIAAMLNGRLVPILRRFYPRAADVLEPMHEGANGSEATRPKGEAPP